VTIRHLIHHTSGIRDYLTLMSVAGMRDDDYYVDGEVVKLLARQKELNFKPGMSFFTAIRDTPAVANRQACFGEDAARVRRREYLQASRHDPDEVLR